MTTGPLPRMRTDAGFGAGSVTAGLARRARGHEPVEHGQRVERAGRALGVVLDGLDRLLAWRSPSTDRSLRLSWLTRNPDAAGSDSPTTWTSWFWAVTWTSPRSTSWTGWFAPWWPNRSRRVSAPAARPTIWWPRQMPEQRPAVVDDRPRQRDLRRRAAPGRPARATGSRRRCRDDRTSAAVAVCGKTRTRAPAMAHRPDDVRLQAEVDDADQRPARPRPRRTR